MTTGQNLFLALSDREVSGRLANSSILPSIVNDSPIRRGFGEEVPNNDARLHLWRLWFKYQHLAEETSKGFLPSGNGWNFYRKLGDLFRYSDYDSTFQAVETQLLPGERNTADLVREIRRHLAAFRREVLVPLKQDMKDALGYAREAGVIEEGRLTVELPLPSFLGSVHASRISYSSSVMARRIGQLLECLSLEGGLLYPEFQTTFARESIIRSGKPLPIPVRNSFAEQGALTAANFHAILGDNIFEQVLEVAAGAPPQTGAALRYTAKVLRLCARRTVKRYRPYWFRQRADASGSETTVPPSTEPAESASGEGVAEE